MENSPKNKYKSNQSKNLLFLKNPRGKKSKKSIII